MLKKYRLDYSLELLLSKYSKNEEKQFYYFCDQL